MKNILLVEDEKDISELIHLHLKREGYSVTLVDNGEKAFELVEHSNFDLAVLDWMLPGLSGLDLCKKIRTVSTPIKNLPILMVTARAHLSDIVLGLEMGADDYITKPFEIPIFLARVRALLRRAQVQKNEPTEPTSITVGELTMDLERHSVSCQGESVQLTPSEFKLLQVLLANRGRVLTREKLIDWVQGEDVTVTDRTVDTHVFGLRKKLGPLADIIETIRGVGYRVKIE